MDHVEYAYTYGMDETAIASHLESTRTGVLSLSDGRDAYAIPVNHYYDEGLYFRLGVTPDSRKRRFWNETETACYVVHGTEETDDPTGLESWSILVQGALEEVPPPERDRFDTAEINRHFSPIRVFDESIEDVDILVAELELDTVTGRTTTPE